MGYQCFPVRSVVQMEVAGLVITLVQLPNYVASQHGIPYVKTRYSLHGGEVSYCVMTVHCIGLVNGYRCFGGTYCLHI
jgi:hypothetical protein